MIDANEFPESNQKESGTPLLILRRDLYKKRNGDHRVIIAGAGAGGECGEMKTRAEWNYIGVRRIDRRPPS